MRLRNPVRNDLEALNALILRSKAMHGYDAGFMAACLDELRVTVDDLDRDELALAEDARGPIGMAQVSFGPEGCTLEKLFVEPARMGTGAGRALFLWAVQAAANVGADDMLIEADPGAEAFYQRMGAVRVGEAPSGSIPGRMLPLMKMQIVYPAR